MGRGVEPAHAHDREIGLSKRRIRPIAGRLVPGGVHEALVLRTGDRKDAELEAVDEDAMWRPFVFKAALGAHGEPTSRDRRET
jgi:hypothetical protein